MVRSLVVSLVAPAGWEPVALGVLTGSVVACEVEVASFAREAPVRRNAIVLAAYQGVALRVVTRGIVTRRVERPRGARNARAAHDVFIRRTRVCRVCRRFLEIVALRVFARGIVTRRFERPRWARNTSVVRDALVRGTVRDVAECIHLGQHVTGFVRRSRSTRAASAFRNVGVFDARGHQDADVTGLLDARIVVWSADGDAVPVAGQRDR